MHNYHIEGLFICGTYAYMCDVSAVNDYLLVMIYDSYRCAIDYGVGILIVVCVMDLDILSSMQRVCVLYE